MPIPPAWQISAAHLHLSLRPQVLASYCGIKHVRVLVAGTSPKQLGLVHSLPQLSVCCLPDLEDLLVCLLPHAGLCYPGVGTSL